MNLSDLVHRTAGDNKVLTTSTTPKAANGTSQTNLFQQSSSLNSNVTTTNNVFLARQDPSSFLFNMPNMNGTEWINNNLFFNNTEGLIVDPNTPTTMLPSNNLDANVFTTIQPQVPLLSQQQQQQQQQRTYQPPTIAPYPSYNNRFDIPQTTINAPTMRATKSSPNMNMMSKPFNNFNSASVTALSSQVSPIIQFNKLVNSKQIQASPSKQNSPITHITSSSVSSPSNLQFSDIVHSSPASTSTSLSPSPSVPPAVVAPPVIVKKPSSVPKLTITGDNVNANNIEEGYVQFVLNHDPHYISDGIESLVYAKRKFLSVPKTGDISYTTWDIYELVLKLHNREIKNWSQLVGQLGLADMAGRPQFAQRVKRWMHRYKIDCYFDYLLGNEFYFNAPNEKYSGCLMMGNYKKKMMRDGEEVVDTNSKKQQGGGGGGEEWDEDGFDTVNGHRVPVLLAGSRKRMRDHSQSSQQMIENARQYLKTNHSEESDEEEEEEEENQTTAMDTDDDTDDEDENTKNSETNGVEDTDEDDNEGEEEEEEEEEEEVDEEDELASTSSSPGSPAISKVNSSPKLVSITPPLIKNTFPIIPSKEESSACTNCSKHETTLNDMKKEIAQLKAYIHTLESTVEQQSTMTAEMNKLLRFKDRTERWRKQLIEDLARGPLLVSEEDEDEDVDDETTDGDA